MSVRRTASGDGRTIGGSAYATTVPSQIASTINTPINGSRTRCVIASRLRLTRESLRSLVRFIVVDCSRSPRGHLVVESPRHQKPLEPREQRIHRKTRNAKAEHRGHYGGHVVALL